MGLTKKILSSLKEEPLISVPSEIVAALLAHQPWKRAQIGVLSSTLSATQYHQALTDKVQEGVNQILRSSFPFMNAHSARYMRVWSLHFPFVNDVFLAHG